MIEIKHTQKRVSNIVEAYKMGFPEEYKTVCDGIEVSRSLQKTAFGDISVELSGAAPQRALHELPEKLYMAILSELDADEFRYFRSMKGSRWFIKKHPEFSLTK